MTRDFARLKLLRTIADGAKQTCLLRSDMAKAFEYDRAQDLARVLKRHDVHFLFIGKGAAIILGFSDTTQDADLFVKKDPANCHGLVAALNELGFPLEPKDEENIRRGKDFIQIRYGPFDLDLIFAPDGIERFEDAEKRSLVIEGTPICHIDDI